MRLLALLALVLGLHAVEADPLAGLKPGHPRLLIDAPAETARIARLKAGAAPRLAALLAGLRQHAAGLLKAPPIERTMKGYRLLDVSRDLLDRSLALGLLWRLDGDVAARERLRGDLLRAAAFSDWNPRHFLDVAEASAAMALGYDWLFDVLSPDERRIVREAIRDKGLRPGAESQDWWTKADNNWNQVCYGGLVIAALAIADDEPDLARRMLARARAQHGLGLAVYAPEGVYPEGPGYWDYGTEYSCLMDAALASACGQDWGLFRQPGFAASFRFRRQVESPAGLLVNYADGGAKPALPACAIWASVRLADPGLAAWAWDRLAAAPAIKGRFAALVALHDEAAAAPPAASASAAWVGRGAVQVACLRGGWEDPKSAFIALKAGRLRINHGHLDAGSVVLDAGGQRFAGDLGSEDAIYAGTDAWGTQAGSKRWTYLRANNLGHNLVVLGGKLQEVEGDNPISGPITRPGFQGAVADLAAAYRGQAAGARRGIALLDGRRMLVQDEFAGIGAGLDARWQLHTEAAVAIAADGRSAILTRKDARLRLRLLEAPAGARFASEAAAPSSPEENQNKGWTRLVLSLPGPLPEPLRLAVLADQPDDAAAPPALRPLSEWPATP